MLNYCNAADNKTILSKKLYIFFNIFPLSSLTIETILRVYQLHTTLYPHTTRILFPIFVLSIFEIFWFEFMYNF